MADHRAEAVLRILRAGLAIGIEFGTHSVESLLGVAEAVQESVMVPHSFLRTREGVSFAFANPPLRCGAFGAVRVRIQQEEVGPDRVRLRHGPGEEWRTAASVTPTAPFCWNPGQGAEFRIAWLDRPRPGRMTVRLELENIAIPPLVWVEFVATPELAPGAR
jgi:hypothetical protein